MVTITEQTKERFRTIPGRIEYGIDFENYAIVGYYMAAYFVKNTDLTKDHFDCLQFLTKTTHPIKGGNFIIASGYREKEKSTTIILMERI